MFYKILWVQFGESSSVDEKIVKINEILIEEYAIKYSTIVVFDGTEYVVKASNVDKKHWDTLRNLQNEDIFKDSITTAKIVVSTWSNACILPLSIIQ